MSVLGKVLAFLNIIAAAAFLVIATMDFARHKNWAYGIASVDRKLEGEPVDKSEQDVEGHTKADDFDSYALKTLPELDGKPLTEQESEVKDIEKRLREKIDVKDPIQKSQRLAGVLRPLAETFARRQALTRVMSMKDPETELTMLDAMGIFERSYKADVGDKINDLLKGSGSFDPTAHEKECSKIYATAMPKRLEQDFDDTFTTLYAKPVQEKRAAITHFLFCMCEPLKDDEKPVPSDVFKSKAFERALTVIGMDQTTKEIQAQTGILIRMANECDLAMYRERQIFVARHDDGLQRIFTLKTQLAEKVRERDEKKKDVELQTKVDDEQEKIVAKVAAELAIAVANSGATFEAKRVMEEALLREQTRLRDQVENIQKLAQDLRSLEEQFPRREAEPR